MSELSKLSPQPLWDIFASICAIPHPSFHEEALATYIFSWAREKGFFAERDSVGNILIRKPASIGLEQLKTVALQAHLDMVPQKNNDTIHDFTKDPIVPRVDGAWVKASNTTLGADNGIGLASALAVLADEHVKHGPLEVLLTMTEEAGMHGAFGLQPNWLQAEILINTDSEQEGEIYAGCAGGITFNTTMAIEREAMPAEYQLLKITIKGLRGGHSGCDIHMGLGNASKILARFLFSHAYILDLRLVELKGGNLRNAIPREAVATLAVSPNSLDKLKTAAQTYLNILKNEVNPLDEQVTILLEEAKTTIQPLKNNCRDRLLSLLNCTPNGVIRYSDTINDVVETSLSMGVVTLSENEASISCLIRSLIESGKAYTVDMLTALGELAGAQTSSHDNYPGWEPDPDSPIMALVKETYHRLFDKMPNIQVIHAGLECGLFKKSYPNMDMVSIGPTITGPHSPDEQVHIGSVNLYWQLLTAVLKAIPAKE